MRLFDLDCWRLLKLVAQWTNICCSFRSRKLHNVHNVKNRTNFPTPSNTYCWLQSEEMNFDSPELHKMKRSSWRNSQFCSKMLVHNSKQVSCHLLALSQIFWTISVSLAFIDASLLHPACTSHEQVLQVRLIWKVLKLHKHTTRRTDKSLFYHQPSKNRACW